MEYKEIEQMSNEALREQIRETDETLQRLKFSHAISQIENPLTIRHTRRLSAKLRTALHARTLAAIEEDIKAGKVNFDNAREYLQGQRLETPVGLNKLKKLIGKHA